MEQFLKQQIVYTLPMVLIYLGGLIVSVTKLRQIPLSATLAALACVVFLLVSVIAPLFTAYMIYGMENGQPQPFGDRDRVFQWVGVVSTMLRGLATCLLLAAVFTNRGESPEDELRRRQVLSDD